MLLPLASNRQGEFKAFLLRVTGLWSLRVLIACGENLAERLRVLEALFRMQSQTGTSIDCGEVRMRMRARAVGA